MIGQGVFSCNRGCSQCGSRSFHRGPLRRLYHSSSLPRRPGWSASFERHSGSPAMSRPCQCSGYSLRKFARCRRPFRRGHSSRIPQMRSRTSSGTRVLPELSYQSPARGCATARPQVPPGVTIVLEAKGRHHRSSSLLMIDQRTAYCTFPRLERFRWDRMTCLVERQADTLSLGRPRHVVPNRPKKRLLS